jgi:hypothetical protein
MNLRNLINLAILCGFTVSCNSFAQPGDRAMSDKSRVLDALFVLENEAKPHYLKIVMRFGDTNSQMVLVMDTDGKTEVREYFAADPGSGSMETAIARIRAANPGISDHDIAVKIGVTIKRKTISKTVVQGSLRALGDLKISPALQSAVCLDECDEYEFSYDTWQESVHYIIVSPARHSQMRRLLDWMNHLRSSVKDNTAGGLD